MHARLTYTEIMSTITYNTSLEHLKLPKYGRHVQMMIDRALTIEDAQQRQAYAENIIRVMDQLNPQMRRTPRYEQILWNHLALMSNYQLDITYPCEIERLTEEAKPHKLSYPGHKIRYRHYGHMLEEALEKLANMDSDTGYRDQYISIVAARMKQDLAYNKGDGLENERIGRDMESYTRGNVKAEEVVHALEQLAPARPNPHVNRYQRKGRRF